jgi:uncharacterized protein
VHVSQLSHKFVNDAREVVKAGDIVKVKVLEVDLTRKRISLTMKLDTVAQRAASGAASGARPSSEARGTGPQCRALPPKKEAEAPNAMAAAFAKLQGLKNKS